jgi:hypothetical protein
VFADHLEKPPDEAVRCPVRKSYPASRPADTRHLRRRLLLVGCEHDAEGRHHGIEAIVGKGQVLGIRDAELDIHAFRHGSLPAPFEQLADIVGRNHIGKAPGGCQRRIAIAGSNIKNNLATADVHCLAEVLSDNLERRAHDRVVTGGPGCLLLLLDCTEIGPCQAHLFHVHCCNSLLL